MSYKRRTLAPDSPYAAVAAVLATLAFCLRLIGFAFGFETLDAYELTVAYLIPAACCLLIAALLISRRNNLMPTVFPVILLFASFSLGTVREEPAVCAASCLFYASFAAVYVLTVTGILNSRLFLLAVCASGALISVFYGIPSRLVAGDASQLFTALSLCAVMTSFFVETRGMRRGRLY